MSLYCYFLHVLTVLLNFIYKFNRIAKKVICSSLFPKLNTLHVHIKQ